MNLPGRGKERTELRAVRHTPWGYWPDEAGLGASTAPLSGDVKADVAIIGGGFAGLWTAWALCEKAPSARVVVLEQAYCGAGASGRNAGFVNSLWHRLPALCDFFGDNAAIATATLAARSVDAISDWASEQPLDIWYRKGGHLEVATNAAQEGRWVAAVEKCGEHGLAKEYRPLTAEEVQTRCASPVFRSGVFMRQAATVQPARLVLALRQALLRRDVAIYERTSVRRLRPSAHGVVVETDTGGRVQAPRAVLAINAASVGVRAVRRGLTVTSTHMVLTEPVPELLHEIGWTGGECISDMRTYLHYFRTTPEGRIAFGWGGGRVAYGAHLAGPVEVDPQLVGEVRDRLTLIFPALASRAISHAWGGPVDVSATRLPIIRSLANGTTFCIYGFTGNGVGPSHFVGRILADLALDERTEFTAAPLIDPHHARVPPEPFRNLGGRLVRRALIRKERKEDEGAGVDPITRALVDLPGRLGMHIGR
jgi:glycine/D-amino acid oxidase-like deaminating enzyme